MSRPWDGDSVVVIAATAPILGLRLGAAYLRFLARRRRAGRIFERALRASGMPKEDAAGLTETYLAASSLRVLIQSTARRRGLR